VTKIVRLLLLLCSFLSSYSQVNAAEIRAVFKAEVIVNSQDFEERNRAIKEGLTQVLKRITGNEKIMERSNVAMTFSQASRYVRQFDYHKIQHQNKYLIKINFNSRAIKQALKRLGIPIWEENRDPVFLWLAINDRNTQVVDNYHNNAMGVRRIAEKEGLLVLLPAKADMEFDDGNIPSSGTISLIASKYRVNSAIAGETKAVGSKWRSNWQIFTNGKEYQLTAEGETINITLKKSFEQVNLLLAKQYAVFHDPFARKGAVTVKISGVRTPNDYFKIKSIFEKSNLMKDFTIISAQKDTLSFEVRSRSSQQAIARFLSTKSQLNRSYTQNGNGIMHYYWRSYD